MKKTLAIMTSLLLCCLAVLPMSAMAAVSGNFEYNPVGDGNCEITGYLSTVTDVVIPSTLDGYSVTDIGYDAFRGKGLTSVDMPNSVFYIMDWSFADNNLTSVNFPAEFGWLGVGVFNNNQITTVNGNPHNGIFYFWDDGWNESFIISYGGAPDVIDFIPSSVDTIGSRAFYGCGLTDVTIPDTVEYIGLSAFGGNEFTHFMLPEGSGPWTCSDGFSYDGGTYVSADYEYRSVAYDFTYVDNGDGSCNITGYTGTETDIFIPAEINELEVKGIADYAMQNMSLTAVTFPEMLNFVGDYAFAGNNLTRVEISYNIELIGEWAFADNNIYSVDLNERASEIGKCAFNDNVITEVNGEPSDGLIYGRRPTYDFWEPDETIVVSYGGASDVIDFLDGVIDIQDSAFINSGITSVTLPENLMIIGDDAFKGNNITSITLPQSMAKIGRGAFENTGITEFTLPMGTLNWAGNESDEYDYLPGQTVSIDIEYIRNNNRPNRIAGVPEQVEVYVQRAQVYHVDLATIFEDINNDHIVYYVSYNGSNYKWCTQMHTEVSETVEAYELVFMAYDHLYISDDTYTVIINVEWGPDINDDGVTDMLDIVEISKYYNTEYPRYEQTRDNFINMFDIVKVAKWVE